MMPGDGANDPGAAAPVAPVASAAPGAPTVSDWRKPVLWMVLSVFLFSLMTVCVKFASRYYNTFEIITFRGLVGAASILAYQQWAHGHGLAAMRTRVPVMHLWRGVIGTTAMLMWFYGLAHLPLPLAVTLNYTSSVWIAVFVIAAAMLAGRRHPPALQALIVGVGFAGVILILRPSSADTDLWAGLIGALSGVFSAMAYLQVASLGRVGEPEYRTVFYFSLFGAGFSLIGAAVLGFSAFSWIGMAWMVPIGLFATAAQLLLTRAFTYGNPMANASLQYLSIVFATFFGWLFFGDVPDGLSWLGMGMVIGSGIAAAAMRRHSLDLATHKDTQLH